MTDPIAPSLQPAPTRPAVTSFLTAGGLVLAIGGLYFGRDIFVPFAVAILLSFVLAPLVNWLQQLKLPKIAAILVAVALAFAVIGALSVVVGTQLVQLADNLPQYQQTITQKIRSLRASSSSGGVVDKVTTTLENIGEELASPKEPAGAARPGTANKPKREPVPVTIEAPGAQPLEVIRTIVGPLLAPLATAGVVIVFVIFILIEREDLRDRFIKLVGAGDLQRTTKALSEAGERVSRYLLMQLVVNVTYGIPIGVGLYFDRRAERGAVGHARGCSALHPLSRPVFGRAVPAGARHRRRSGVVHADVDHSAYPRR